MIPTLAARGVRVHRVNTGWFPAQMQLTAELHRDRWAGTLTTPRGPVELDDVTAVWYRSPEAYAMPAELSPGEAQHARAEAKYGLGGVLASLPALWCNHRTDHDHAVGPVDVVAAQCNGFPHAHASGRQEPDHGLEGGQLAAR